jgi:hypothetical protein
MHIKYPPVPHSQGKYPPVDARKLHQVEGVLLVEDFLGIGIASEHGPIVPRDEYQDYAHAMVYIGVCSPMTEEVFVRECHTEFTDVEFHGQDEKQVRESIYRKVWRSILGWNCEGDNVAEDQSPHEINLAADGFLPLAD